MRGALNLLRVVGLFAVLAAATTVARGEDFRVDTDVFVGASKEPVAEVLTIFQAGRVWDFQLTKPDAQPAKAGPQRAQTEEITLFEPQRGMLTLIDGGRRVRVSLTTNELLNAAIDLQTAVTQQKNPNPIFLAASKPVFDVTSEEFEENGNKFTRLNFAGRPIQYTVTGQVAKHPAAATEYRYFSDWSARLSSLRPGNLPAGARLEVNDALAKKDLIPKEVHRVIHETALTRVGYVPKKIEVRSQHLVVWALSQEDHKRIDRAGDLLANSKPVSFEEFCGMGAPKAVVATPQQQARK